MIAPLALGPMTFSSVLFYHGEANIGSAGYYACAFPSLITHWRAAFNHSLLPFIFVQVW